MTTTKQMKEEHLSFMVTMAVVYEALYNNTEQAFPLLLVRMVKQVRMDKFVSTGLQKVHLAGRMENLCMNMLQMDRPLAQLSTHREQQLSYTDLGTTISGVQLNQDVSGIPTMKNYRWRERIKYSPVNNPYQVLWSVAVLHIISTILVWQFQTAGCTAASRTCHLYCNFQWFLSYSSLENCDRGE